MEQIEMLVSQQNQGAFWGARMEMHCFLDSLSIGVMNMNDVDKITGFLDSIAFSDGSAGNSKRNDIDKEGFFYHTTQKAWGGMALFNNDIARYRNHLMCELCIRYEITVLYSVVMPTHTHDVLYSKNWRNISDMYRVLNSSLVRYVSHRYPQRKGLRLFCERPQYTVIREMLHLFFLGKYVEDNASSREGEGKGVPYSCFWMFENGHFQPPYNKDIYETLFGIPFKELYMSSIRRIRRRRFGLKLSVGLAPGLLR